jgi:Tol biopolymer transport system component
VDELYPKPSPDGTKICFVTDEGQGDDKVRSVYYMNSDGTGRTKVAENGGEPSRRTSRGRTCRWSR